MQFKKKTKKKLNNDKKVAKVLIIMILLSISQLYRYQHQIMLESLWIGALVVEFVYNCFISLINVNHFELQYVNVVDI